MVVVATTDESRLCWCWFCGHHASYALLLLLLLRLCCVWLVSGVRSPPPPKQYHTLCVYICAINTHTHTSATKIRASFSDTPLHAQRKHQRIMCMYIRRALYTHVHFLHPLPSLPQSALKPIHHPSIHPSSSTHHKLHTTSISLLYAVARAHARISIHTTQHNTHHTHSLYTHNLCVR